MHWVFLLESTAVGSRGMPYSAVEIRLGGHVMGTQTKSLQQEKETRGCNPTATASRPGFFFIS